MDTSGDDADVQETPSASRAGMWAGVAVMAFLLLIAGGIVGLVVGSRSSGGPDIEQEAVTVDPLFEARSQCFDEITYWVTVMANGGTTEVAMEFGAASDMYQAVVSIYAEVTPIRYGQGREAGDQAQGEAVADVCEAWLPGDQAAEARFGYERSR